jgi:hypothetical protein
MLRRVVVDGREHIDELTYYSDGRGERNPSAFGEDALKTKTEWEGTALVSRGSTRLGSGIVDVTERRELGVNGTQLIISVKLRGWSTLAIKQTFDRTS